MPARARSWRSGGERAASARARPPRALPKSGAAWQRGPAKGEPDGRPASATGRCAGPFSGRGLPAALPARPEDRLGRLRVLAAERGLPGGGKRRGSRRAPGPWRSAIGWTRFLGRGGTGGGSRAEGSRVAGAIRAPRRAGGERRPPLGSALANRPRQARHGAAVFRRRLLSVAPGLKSEAGMGLSALARRDPHRPAAAQRREGPRARLDLASPPKKQRGRARTTTSRPRWTAARPRPAIGCPEGRTEAWSPTRPPPAPLILAGSGASAPGLQ